MSEIEELENRLIAINPEDSGKIKERDPKYMDADKSFIKTLLQGAINVELFTIPLYMTSMYSIVGLHQVNSKGRDFYKGRWWPGSAPSSTPDESTQKNPSTANKKAFNNIFSLFMEEMLHLQLASNIASKLGVSPSFTSPALQSDKNAWICYGSETKPSKTIPHIIDFDDCKAPYSDIDVKLDALNKNQIDLFMAIEESLEDAHKRIKPEAWKKYSHQAPYDNWTTASTESDLPLFGSIGKMYETLWAYIEITYSDGTTLLDELLKEKDAGLQRDQFNTTTESHPKEEFPHIVTTLVEYSSELMLKVELLNIINAITDQGEGKGVVQSILDIWDTENILAKHIASKKGSFSHPHANMQDVMRSVSPNFQPDEEALKENYKGYDDKGNQTEISGQAKARIDAAKDDHYETFKLVKELMKEEDFSTWDQWHAQGKRWSKELLEESDIKSSYNIPSADDVADALNELKENNTEENYKLLSLGAVGTLKGVTTALDTYWNTQDAEFPHPAMTGSGDRISICWAITGKKPDLLLGIDKADSNKEMFNACQGMSLMNGEVGKDQMPDVRIYHSCKGSNECKTQGGCGFVQSANGGGQCGSSVQSGSDALMSAPGNNKCGAKGGCAVPISASQLFPSEGRMQIYTYKGDPDFTTKEIEEMPYKVGDAVYDIAWKAYSKALEVRGENPPLEQPKPNPLRVAFPPST